MRSSNEKEKFWREQLRLADRFDGSQVEFCRQNSLSHHTFQYWRKKFASRSRSAPIAAVVADPFVKVQVDRLSSLPDPRWFADLIWHLHQGGPR